MKINLRPYKLIKNLRAEGMVLLTDNMYWQFRANRQEAQIRENQRQIDARNKQLNAIRHAAEHLEMSGQHIGTMLLEILRNAHTGIYDQEIPKLTSTKEGLKRG